MRMDDTTRSDWQREGTSWYADESKAFLDCYVCKGQFFMIQHLRRGTERIQLCGDCGKLVEDGWLDLILLAKEATE